MNSTKEILEQWKNQDGNSKIKIKQYLNDLKSVPEEELMSILEEENRTVFHQFDCLQCGNCCKTTPPIFLKSDVKRISKSLNMPPKIFIKKYLIEDVDGTLIGNGVPCRFLKEDNSCDIYEVRPKACRGFPHMDEKGFKYRNDLNFNNTLICPIALRIVENVKSRLLA